MDLFSICRVIALDLVKICIFQLVSCISQKYFFYRNRSCICSCAPGGLIVDLFSICRVALTIPECSVLCEPSYRNDDQQHSEAVHLGFFM
jgi:hypothetical protein